MEEETSPVFKSSFSQGALPSPDGSLVASIQGSRLVLQDATTYEIKRTTQLPSELAGNVCFLKWSPSRARSLGREGNEESINAPPPLRLLVADDQSIEIYDANDSDWKAVLDPGFGGMKFVDFGCNADEVLVLSEFGLKVTIWSLKSNFHIDLQHPKLGPKGLGYRPGTNQFALLTRPAAHDVLNIYSTQSYTPIKSVELPTVDAQALKWSPDGRWIAIWDSPSAGYRVLLYTANGQMFRTHEQPVVGLGLRTVEWSSDGEYLVLGGYDGSVIEMRHLTEVKILATDVWSEELSVQGERNYTLITPPVNLPTVESVASDPNPKTGVSVLSFSPNNILVATKDEKMPSSVWIWSLENLRTLAVLVQLSQVKAIQWHPSRGDLLAVVCGADPSNVTANNIPSVYLWSQHWDYPRTIQVSRDLVAAHLWLRWIDDKGLQSVREDVGFDETMEGDEVSNVEAPVAPIYFVVGDKERYQIIRLEEATAVGE
ncbi:hypothetical protein H072_2774 [Dactylellina haptotyla CBS 200.50]|uniref:Anaphase-promoting complex subunit 4 WD40 domain-containing protein n=1 Tax=Dactylellina haptotyla (strain CBS 200.50) TaxID=1284197 RepID=S8AK11_DACHA|nr:hypothetical protein H072_2774 [Dactylellina haptotyla CBS 200.50]